MKIQFFFFINSILIYNTRNINLYKKSLSSRKLQESDTLITDTVTTFLGNTYKEVGSDTAEMKESTNYDDQPTNYSQSLLANYFLNKQAI